MTIYLASKSPRRNMLLKKMGLNFQRIEPKSEEILDEKLSPEENTKKIAIQKAYSVINEIKEGVIIAADTIVVKDNKILGKPKDKKDALSMLTKLNGTRHFVFTAVVVLDKKTEKIEVKVEKTKVEMRQMSERELQEYVDSGEPLDAAGAYKIQEKGAKFIKRIEGCFYNVCGLPIATLVEMLKRFNIEV